MRFTSCYSLIFASVLVAAVTSSRCHAQEPVDANAPPIPAAAADDAVVPPPPAESHLVVRQWVRRSADGSLQGRVVVPGLRSTAAPVAHARIALVGFDGRVHRATSDADGRFAVPDLPQGVYALTAQGPRSFAAYALHVLDADSGAGAASEGLEIAAAVIDRATVNMSILRYLPPRDHNAIVRPLGDAALIAMSERVCANVTSRVAQIDGGLRGVIRLAGGDGQKLAPAPMVNVFITQDGEEVARTVTDPEGRFVIDALLPGSYALLAVGPGGLGSVGFELMAEDAAVQASAMRPNPFRLAARGHDPQCSDCFCDALGLQIAPVPQIVDGVQAVLPDDQIIEPLAADGVPMPGEFPGPPYDAYGFPGGGGFAGGGGGFAGGGGGGGGFLGGGGLAGLAALGGIAALIAADDDDVEFVVPEPISPSVP